MMIIFLVGYNDYQGGFRVYSDDITPYLQYQSYNPYTLW